MADKFFRVSLEGKRQRTVFILIDRTTWDNIQLFLKYRIEAGVSENNPYVFGFGEHSFLSGSRSIAKFSESCGAEKPYLLRSTLLRRNLATFSQLMNLSDQDKRALTTFLGHSLQVHETFYNKPLDVVHICKLSKLLTALDKGQSKVCIQKSFDEIE